MPYRIRLLSTSPDCVPVTQLQTVLDAADFNATLSLEDGSNDDWIQIIISHKDGTAISLVERDLVEEGSLAEGELAEFAEEIRQCKPATAVDWLLHYFLRIKCIYAFQILSGADQANGWDILYAVREQLREIAPSIGQADAEGFSNEDGYQILWQFKDSVEGNWWMAVLRDSKWVRFEMDLASRRQREDFFSGLVPRGVKFQ